MSLRRTDWLAVRCLNQYRRRDILSYVGLKYLLANSCARQDYWSRAVGGHLVLTRESAAYHHSQHFKEAPAPDKIEHRAIHLPGPNECAAEAALLDVCSEHPHVFDPQACVYSYRLSQGAQVQGLFKPYFEGFRERHRAVTSACRAESDVEVQYTDIKKFYPTITSAVALKVWNAACDKAQLDTRHRELGIKMLNHHMATAALLPRCAGILTGPMFSHLIGNLVLSEVDARMVAVSQGRYYRYVDDIILVGSSDHVRSQRSALVDLLGDLGLHLHDGNKDFVVGGVEWLEGADDFEDTGIRRGWMRFIADLKILLLCKPKARTCLMTRFLEEGMRIPTLDYAQAVEEARRTGGLLYRMEDDWFCWKARDTTIDSVLSQAVQLRNAYGQELRTRLSRLHGLTGYSEKRELPKIRLLAIRLLYLGRIDDLLDLAVGLLQHPQLFVLGVIYRSVATRDCSQVVGLGTNAVQSAAQVLRLDSAPVHCSPARWDSVSIQGLALLRLNGLSVRLQDASSPPLDELNRFALWDDTSTALMTSSDPFMRELACLHGKGLTSRHTEALDIAIDRDEHLAFDAISQLLHSSSG